MSADHLRSLLYWDVRDYSEAARAYMGITAHNSDPQFDQEAFAFGDPGTESGHALDTQDTDRTVQEDGNGDYQFFLRWMIAQTLTNADQNLTTTFKLQYQKNGGGYVDVTAASSNVRVVDDPNITDGATTTQRLTGGSGVAIAGRYDEGDGVWPSITWDPATNNREQADFLSSLEIVDADMADGDVLDFRVVESDGTVLDLYSVANATLTWEAPPAGSETLVVDDASHGHTADAPALIQANLLTVDDANHAHAADSPALVQANVLAADDSGHTHAADNIDLNLGATLVVGDATHSHAADNVDLAQAYLLAVGSALHGHQADSVALTQANVLSVAGALHDHAADNLDLTEAAVLTVVDALHAHSADGVTFPADSSPVDASPRLPQYWTMSWWWYAATATLEVQDASHGHAADGVVLLPEWTLAVADADHAHAAESPALVQASVLAPADALHAHAADGLTLTQANQLAVQAALHAHSADSPTLSLETLLTVADALHAHAADSPALVQAHMLAVADALHAHLSDTPGLTQAHVLAVLDALHAHSADNLVLSALTLTIAGQDILGATGNVNRLGETGNVNILGAT